MYIFIDGSEVTRKDDYTPGDLMCADGGDLIIIHVSDDEVRKYSEGEWLDLEVE